jgi:hypothetical protein
MGKLIFYYFVIKFIFILFLYKKSRFQFLNYNILYFLEQKNIFIEIILKEKKNLKKLFKTFILIK